MKAILCGLAVLMCVAPSAGAVGLVATKEQKTQFLQKLNSALEHAKKAEQESRKRVQAAQAKIMELQRRYNELAQKIKSNEMPSDGNRQAVEITVAMLCDPNISLPMGAKQFGYDRGWEYFMTWGKRVADMLVKDPVENPYLWYGRYDFYATVDLYEAYDKTIHQKRDAFMRQVCDRIKTDFLDRLYAQAAQLDDLNAQSAGIKEKMNAASRLENEGQRKTVLEALKSQADRIKTEGDRVKAGMDRIGAAMQQALQERSLDMRYEMNRLMAKLKGLQVPERGKVEQIVPETIRFRNRNEFSVIFKGRGLPEGLAAGDFEFPAGLGLIEYQGGGNRLYVRLKKTAALKAGRQSFQIAGEKISFMFDDSPEENRELLAPFVQKGTTLPAGTGSVPEDGKGTFLTADALLDYPQDLEGFWIIDPNRKKEETSAPLHFGFFKDEKAEDWLVLKGIHRASSTYQDLKPHQKMPLAQIAGKGIIGQYATRNGDCFNGLRATKEIPKPDGAEVCPFDRWWEPSEVCFDPNHLSAKEMTPGREHDEKTCEATEEPSESASEYKRFIGLNFTPFQPGKYIYTLTVAAPFAYKAAVGLEWDYTLLEPAKISFKITYGAPDAVIKEIPAPPLSNKGQGYVFVAEQPGKYWFIIEVFDAAGKRIHRDMAAAYLEMFF